MEALEKRLSLAIKQFWSVRRKQSIRQSLEQERRDRGQRAAVTGGAQLVGFANLIKELLIEAGVPDINIFSNRVTLPGYFRPVKDWDLSVIINGNLIASIELKSHVGPSFGNNFNNRVEEALGSATDIWRAYREGVFKPSPQPWLGYLMVLEDHKGSKSPVRVSERHFKVFPEFINSSYAKRYELFCERLVRERLYNSACLIMTNHESGLKGKYTEPSEELTFKFFVKSLIAHSATFSKK